jgi:hypothetical protein
MASKAKSLEPPAVPLNAILEPLTDALRQSCRRSDLALNEIGQTSLSRSLYALTGAGSVRASTDRACILHQLFPKSNPELWLGILLELRKRAAYPSFANKDMYEVFHVSIQAFEGATSQTIEPLLRAEWDPIVARSQDGPAQPHWHAYARASTAAEQGFTSEGFRDFAMRLPLESIKRRQHKVHFALCANWHKEGGSNFEVLSTPDELRRWVLGAIDYIKSQA